MNDRILYVGLSAPDDKSSIASKLIRWAEADHNWFDPRTWFRLWFASHTFIAYPAHRYRPFYMVSEAAGTMVRFVSQPHFESHADVSHLYRFEFDEMTYRAIKVYGELHAGAPYAFMENVGIAWVRLVKLITGKTVANPFGAGEGAQKCSELVMRNVIYRLIKNYNLTPKALSIEVYNTRGHVLPPDIENIGVRDIYEVLEHLVGVGFIERVEPNDPMRVESVSMSA